MIYIIHGENTSQSRNQILGLQKNIKASSKFEFHILKTTPEELREKLIAQDIFGSTPFIVLDVSKAGRMNFDSFIEVIKFTPAPSVLVIYSETELPKTNAFLKKSATFPAKVLLSRKIQDSNVFKLIDAVFDLDRARCYKELTHLMLAGEDPVYIFTMLAYGLRNISYIVFESPAANKIPPFSKSKIVSQAKGFSHEAVAGIYETFYNLDRDAKTGMFPMDLLAVKAVESVLSA